MQLAEMLQADGKKPLRFVARRKPSVPGEDVEIGNAYRIEKAAGGNVFVRKVGTEGGNKIAAAKRAEVERRATAQHSAVGKEQKSKERRNGNGY